MTTDTLWQRCNRVKLRWLWLLAVLGCPALAEEFPKIMWRQIPPIPDPCGFASPFVGVAGDALLLAGGANFPEKQMWEGGQKTWHDGVFLLLPGNTDWKRVGKLRNPLAYGLAISTPDGVLCAGGSDAKRHYSDVFLTQWKDGNLSFKDLPSLPKPVAMGAGARVGNIVYLMGGLESPLAKERLNTFYALDLENISAGWRTLPACPGPARSQAVAASAGGDFYLFSGLRSGTAAEAGKDIYLADAYRYSPRAGWERLADLPHAAVAGASPAPVLDADAIFLVGGVEGSDPNSKPEQFQLTPQRIQVYSAKAKTWADGGNAPVGRVCVSTTEWMGAWILANGERSAGIRSPEVWSLRFPVEDQRRLGQFLKKGH